mmetsp:Transcript_22648/g.52275  ORF Transcript_22648/g.52275 Transcript_22648/m.52275 type:complete len:116 (+) Transcript_22648:293-640(+)
MEKRIDRTADKDVTIKRGSFNRLQVRLPFSLSRNSRDPHVVVCHTRGGDVRQGWGSKQDNVLHDRKIIHLSTFQVRYAPVYFIAHDGVLHAESIQHGQVESAPQSPSPLLNQNDW